MLLRFLNKAEKTAVSVDDFNINLLCQSHTVPIVNELQVTGFRQKVQNATHNSGPLTNHVYSNRDVTICQTATYDSEQIFVLLIRHV